MELGNFSGNFSCFMPRMNGYFKMSKILSSSLYLVSMKFLKLSYKLR